MSSTNERLYWKTINDFWSPIFPIILEVDKFFNTRNGLKADNIQAGEVPASRPVKTA